MHDLTQHLDDIAGGFMPLQGLPTDVAPIAIAPAPPLRLFRTNG